MMLQRSQPYSGDRRCKLSVILVGQRKAVAIAARSVTGRRRWSQLSERPGAAPDEARACLRGLTSDPACLS